MDGVLALSPSLSPQLLTQNPSSPKFRHFHPKFTASNPNIRISSSTFRLSSFASPKSSLQFHQTTRNSPNFDPSFNLGFDEIGLSPVLASSTSAPQTQETATSDALADVMGLLFRERVVFLGSSIDNFLADAIISQLMLLDAQNPTKDIRLFINSCGGSLSATIAIIDVVQLLRADVSTVAFGICASTASLILCSGSKGKRLAMPNARIMIDQPQGGTSGLARDVEMYAREIMQDKDYVIRIISERSGRPYDQVQKDLDKDLYMSPVEAVDYGLIDGVIDREKIIPIPPLPERVKSRFNFEEIHKNPRKFLMPEIPDDEIY